MLSLVILYYRGGFMNEYLKTEEVAEILSVTPYTVRKYARQGKLPGSKINKSWRFKKSAILKLLNGEEGGEKS